MRFSPHIKSVQFPPITEVKSWLAENRIPSDRPLIDLCQAIPDYAPSSDLVAFLRRQLDDPQISRYSPDEGLEEVRNAVSRWYGRRYGRSPQPEDICLTIGASQAFWLAITVLCQSGDEVIVPLPAYFDHPMALSSLGIKPVWAAFRSTTGGQPDIAEISDLITPRTRAILLVTPNNPTGAVIPPETLLQLFLLAKEHNIALIVDETYNAFLLSDEVPHTLFSEPDWREHFIHIASFGKTFALTGYRAGALIAGPEVIQQALKVQDSMAVCQPCITQQAIRFGCDHLDDWVTANAIAMKDRHDRFCSLFSTPENSFDLLTSGSFFAWIKHPWDHLSSHAAAYRLLEEVQVVSLPGEAFGPGLHNCLRLAFGNLKTGIIPAAVDRFIQVEKG